MREGWHGDDYLILFADSELDAASARYAISELLPGYVVIGLRGWDDLIVKDSRERIFSVPTLPLSIGALSPFSIPKRPEELEADTRFTGTIKWYIKPIVFGGDPKLEENTLWVDHSSHGDLVRWWNRLYRELKSSG